MITYTKRYSNNDFDSVSPKFKFELYILQTTKLYRNCIHFPLCALNNVYVPLNKLTNNRKIVSTCVHSSILK